VPNALPTAIALVLVLVADRAAEAAPAGHPPIAIVVGVRSPLGRVGRDELRELYLRRRRLWPNGERAMPVNLPADSPIRGAFSKQILGREPVDLESYWRRLYFEGIRPPLVLKTPRAVCAYVAAEDSAIGYVPADDVDRESCRVLLLLGDETD
jgi:hypothetical protein